MLAALAALFLLQAQESKGAPGSTPVPKPDFPRFPHAEIGEPVPSE